MSPSFCCGSAPSPPASHPRSGQFSPLLLRSTPPISHSCDKPQKLCSPTRHPLPSPESHERGLCPAGPRGPRAEHSACLVANAQQTRREGARRTRGASPVRPRPPGVMVQLVLVAGSPGTQAPRVPGCSARARALCVHRGPLDPSTAGRCHCHPVFSGEAAGMERPWSRWAAGPGPGPGMGSPPVF